MRVGASASSVGLALGLALLAAGTAQAGPGLVLTIELDKPSFVLFESVTRAIASAIDTTEQWAESRAAFHKAAEICLSPRSDDGATVIQEEFSK
jgi:hypothetical protein